MSATILCPVRPRWMTGPRKFVWGKKQDATQNPTYKDNNAAENAIRPFVVGRKAWLFSDTQAGARASALLYSLVETTKANNVEPYLWLRHVLRALPTATTVEHFEALLPWNLNAEQLITA